MTTKTILGLAAASLFALAPLANAQEIKSKDPVISSQSAGALIPIIIGGVATTIVVAAASSGGGGGSSNNTVIVNR